MRDIQGQAINIEVWFANVNEGRDDKEIDELFQVEALDAILGNLAAFVAHHGHAQPIDGLSRFTRSIVSW